MARPPFQPAPGMMPGQRPPMMMGPRGPMPPRPGMPGAPPMGLQPGQRPPFVSFCSASSSNSGLSRYMRYCAVWPIIESFVL